MSENNPITVEATKEYLAGNPITPPATPVVTATETNTVTAPVETANIGGTQPTTVPTPTATQTPTPTPTPAPTAPSPTDYKWDEKSGTYKEVAKTETPATPTATTATPKAEPTKVPGTDKTQAEFDVYVGREKEVLDNLNSAYASGIKDGDGIRKFASYDTASPEKKAAIDAFILGKRNEEKSAQSGSQFGTEDGIYGALVNNVMVPDSAKNTPAYKSAITRFQKFKFLSSASADTLKELLKSGKLVPGTKTYNDYYATEAGKKALDKANKLLSVSGGTVDVTKAGENMTGEVLKSAVTVKSALDDNQITPEELAALTTTPALEAQGKSLATKKLEIEKLQQTKKGIYDDVKAQYGGVLTGSEAARVVANRTREIDRSLETLILEHNTEFSQYSQEKEKLLSIFDTNLKLFQESRKAELDKLAKIEEREYEEKKEKSKRVYDSVNSQIKFALENGVDLMRTDANVIIGDAEKYAEANGVSLEQAINETFTRPLTSKPSYARALQAIYDKNSGALTPYQKAQLAQGDRNFALDMAKLGWEKEKFALDEKEKKEGWKYDTVGYDDYGNAIKGWTKPPVNGVPQEQASNIGTGLKVGEKGGQCVEFARKETGFTSGLNAVIGSNISERRAKMRDSSPVVGGLVLFDGGGYDKTYGHVAVVTGVNPDGTINVRESNFRNDEKVTERNNVPTTYVKGYYNDTPIARGDGSSPHPDAVAKLALYNNGTDYDSIMKTIGSSKAGLKIKGDFDRLVASQGGSAILPTSNKVVEGFAKLEKELDDVLKNDDQIGDTTGMMASAIWSPIDVMTKERQTFLNKIDTVLKDETLNKLISAKDSGATFGALSNEELRMLQGASSALNNAAVRDEKTQRIKYFEMTEDEFRKQLGILKGNFSGKADKLTGGEYSKKKSGGGDSLPSSVMDRTSAQSALDAYRKSK